VTDVLLGDRFAPATSEVGFIEAATDVVAEQLIDWRRGLPYLRSSVSAKRLEQPFPEILDRLAPLSVARHARELVVPTQSAWTAYFDNGHQGTDSSAPIVVAGKLGVRFVWVSCVPDVRQPLRYGSTQLWLQGPDGQGPSRDVRSIAAVNDGGRWMFDLSGTPQAFEHPENYNAPRIRDRFTPAHLAEYCAALDIDYFNPEFYGPTGWLVEDTRPDTPPFRSKSWDQVRIEIGLPPRDR
jgi:hypothetical protein